MCAAMAIRSAAAAAAAVQKQQQQQRGAVARDTAGASQRAAGLASTSATAVLHSVKGKIMQGKYAAASAAFAGPRGAAKYNQWRPSGGGSGSGSGGGGGAGKGTSAVVPTDLRQYVAMAEAGPLRDELKRMGGKATSTELWYDKSRLVGLLPKKGEQVLSYRHPERGDTR